MAFTAPVGCRLPVSQPFCRCAVSLIEATASFAQRRAQRRPDRPWDTFCLTCQSSPYSEPSWSRYRSYLCPASVRASGRTSGRIASTSITPAIGVAYPSDSSRQVLSGERQPAPPILLFHGRSIEYARNGNVRLAYQVVGAGPIDILSTPEYPFAPPLDNSQDEPRLSLAIYDLSSFWRLILWDPRGVGLSDCFALRIRSSTRWPMHCPCLTVCQSKLSSSDGGRVALRDALRLYAPRAD